MTQISGKLNSFIVDEFTHENRLPKFGDEATIELPAVDIEKIKAGYEVWIRKKVEERQPGDIYFCCPMTKGIDSVVAHFPQQFKSEKLAKKELETAIAEILEARTGIGATRGDEIRWKVKGIMRLIMEEGRNV